MATIQPSGSSIATYYLVTDQLDTPREIIRPSDNTIMWSWFTGPFGAEAPNTNPQGAGIFAYDMRLPGQIAGAWGSTYQNNFRDYDPEVGRYMEPDPIGLVGGSLSLYAYAAGNALTRIDPSGLSSIDAEIADAIASGDLEELESLLEGANPDQAKLIQDAIQRWTSTADQLISKECQARVRTRFPKSVLNNTLKEIQELSQDGDKDAQTAWKLLNDNRFKK
jgi:RHS repeat-associated protein